MLSSFCSSQAGLQPLLQTQLMHLYLYTLFHTISLYPKYLIFILTSKSYSFMGLKEVSIYLIIWFWTNSKSIFLFSIEFLHTSNFIGESIPLEFCLLNKYKDHASCYVLFHDTQHRTLYFYLSK